MLGICLIAMFALGAIMAGGASAKLPEFGACEAAPNHEGKYADANCVQPVKKVFKKYTGGYEWYAGNEFGTIRGEGFPSGWDAHLRSGGSRSGGLKIAAGENSIGTTTFEDSAGKQMVCSGGYINVVTGPANNQVQFREIYLTGCQVGSAYCTSSGGFEPGEVNNLYEFSYTESEESAIPFVGTLGYINKADHTVGLSIRQPTGGEVYGQGFEKEEPQERNEQPLFIARCELPVGTITIGGGEAKRNGVIAEIGPLNTMTNASTLTFTESHGVQSPSKVQPGGKFTFAGEWEGFNHSLGINATWNVEEEGGETEDYEIKAIP
jgi:hypothetical protein